MSASGQKRTCAVQNVMSALPPKADKRGCKNQARLNEKSGISARSMAGEKVCDPTHAIKRGIAHGDEPQDEIKDRRTGTVPRNG